MAKHVSVVIPTVDRPALLGQSVASVLAQDEGAVEVIVVFDGRPAARVFDDDRVRVTSTGDTALGVGGARNHGAAMADGTHIAFLDDDDLWVPDRLSMALTAVDAAPVVVSWSRFLGRADERRGRDLSGNVEGTILNSLTPSVGAVLVDRNAFLDFDTQWRAVEDIDWWIRTARNFPVITVPHTGHVVRRHDGERFGNGHAERVQENLALLDWHRDWFDEHPQAEAFRLRRAAFYAARCGDETSARALLRRSVRRHASLRGIRQLAHTYRS